ncbi:MAG: Ferrous-iron efflux pump FieF [Turneriella sp.]|nr:Ferrous-iron efflux pump FieF [Turneriella sp.]
MAQGKKAIYYALAANSGIAITKSVAAFFTASTSMMAEAIHSFTDCGNQLLLLIGLKRAKAPATQLHPMGYGKVSYFWSFLVALFLFLAGGVFSIYEGSHKLLEPQPLENAWVAILVLGIGIVLEALSLKGALREINSARGNRGFYRWFRETRQSELMVIAGEDVAALLGLGIALFFVLLTLITGNPIFDAVGSIAIGLLLITIATMLTFEIKSLIIGESADDDFKKKFYAFITEKYPHITLLNVITQHYGQDIVLAIKARFKKWPTSAALLVNSINQIEKNIRANFSEVRFIFFEPDISSEEKRAERENINKKRKKV